VTQPDPQNRMALPVKRGRPTLAEVAARPPLQDMRPASSGAAPCSRCGHVFKQAVYARLDDGTRITRCPCCGTKFRLLV
jgi:DNA-directed RNA polymerase subunit RPC12/RpoP